MVIKSTLHNIYIYEFPFRYTRTSTFNRRSHALYEAKQDTTPSKQFWIKLRFQRVP